MSKIAFLFPGQGSQSVGMAGALAEHFPVAQTLFEEASSQLGWDLLKTCREGSEDTLRQTHIAQPALYVTGYATCCVLEEQGLHPDAVAGHSIGEYAALAAAHVFSFKEGLALVQERGRLMQEAGQKHPGSMAAILGLTGEQVHSICQSQPKGVCAAVNFNSPEQTVIAGESPALEEVSRLAAEQGAQRVIPLNVSGAFHSPLMEEAARAMAERLKKQPFQNAIVPVVMNVDGHRAQQAGEIQSRLSQQLDHAVQWVRTIQTLKADGCRQFVECGPGRVLSGLLRRIDKTLEAFSTETPEALLLAVEGLNTAKRGIP